MKADRRASRVPPLQQLINSPPELADESYFVRLTNAARIASRRSRVSGDFAAADASVAAFRAWSISLRPSGLVATLCAWAISFFPSALLATRTACLSAFRPAGLLTKLNAFDSGVTSAL
jgi:hypothetical protein